MNTMYYLEQETKQKIKQFHHEKDAERLQSVVGEGQTVIRLSRLVQKIFQVLRSQRINRPEMQHPVQSTSLLAFNDSLDEA